MYGMVQTDQPRYKGGENSLFSFIKNNQIYPEYSKANCLQGTIYINFKLNNRGKIYNSTVQKGFDTDLDVEALRLVRLTSDQWIIPVEYDTTTAITLPINFSLKDYNCEQRNKDEIKAAIAAYHARTDLTKAIFNFYDKKSMGQHNVEEEAGILALKVQLGYTEKYLERLLKQALRKLKQGDKEGGCEDLTIIHRLGSDIGKSSLQKTCK